MEITRTITERTSQRLEPLIINKYITFILVSIGISLLGIAVFLWIQGEYDQWFLFSHDALRSIKSIATAGKVASKYGMPIILLIYLIYLMLAFNNEKLRVAYKITILVFLMFGLVGLGGDLLKEIIGRPRPFVTYVGEYIAFSDAGTPAFPSGHATKSMALALPFLVLIPVRDKWHIALKILLAVVALSVSYSRVLLGAHYVSDVLAGIGLSMICLPIVTHLTNKVLEKMNKERLDMAVKIWAVILFGLMVFLVLS